MIGLTGGIASGKSTVSARLAELGACIIDADRIAQEVTSSDVLIEAIRSVFGESVVFVDNDDKMHINRKVLAAMAFATPETVERLNEITHPAIVREILEKAFEAEKSGKYPLVVIDVPLLIEAGMQAFCDSVWLVTADEETRIHRIIERDNITRAQAQLRISRQLADSEKRKFADIIIENNGTEDELIEKVDAIYRTMLEEI